MKQGIELQVSSLELSKRLKELEAPQKSVFYYVKNADDDGFTLYYRLSSQPDFWQEYYAAYTVAELGEMLRKCITNGGKEYWLNQAWMSHGFTLGYVSRPSHKLIDDNEIVARTEADARAKMLIHLIEQGRVDVKLLGNKEI